MTIVIIVVISFRWPQYFWAHQQHGRLPYGPGTFFFVHQKALGNSSLGDSMGRIINNNKQWPGDSTWPFYPLVEGHKQPLKGSQITIHKKVTKNRQGHDMTMTIDLKTTKPLKITISQTPLDLGKSSRSNIVGEASAVWVFRSQDLSPGKPTETDDWLSCQDPNNVSASATVRNTRDLFCPSSIVSLFFFWSRNFCWLVENVWKNPTLFFGA